jgi:hypothetical protein
MKLENKILLSIIIIGLILFSILLYKELKPYQEEALLSRSPLTEIKILNQKIEINKIDRLYKNSIDCSNLQENEQIISYKLVEGKENYKVSTNIQIFKDNKLLTTNYQEATNIITRLTIKDKNNQYEQIYIIESTCQQGDIS